MEGGHDIRNQSWPIGDTKIKDMSSFVKWKVMVGRNHEYYAREKLGKKSKENLSNAH